MRQVHFNKYRVKPQPDRRAARKVAQVEENVDQLLTTGEAWRAPDPWIGKYAAALAQLRDDRD